MATIDIVFPHAGQRYNGIGDHTAQVSRVLARDHSVRVLGMGENRVEAPVDYLNAWPDQNLRHLGTLKQALATRRPDLVVVQFEQFAYGPRGFNPEFARLLAWVRRNVSTSRRVAYMHETYTMPGSLGHTVMWAYQRAQARKLVKSADLVLFASGVGVAQLGRTSGSFALAPVPSNLLRVASDTDLTRRGWDADPEALVVGVFGYLDTFRIDYIRSALAAISEVRSVHLVYVGKDVARAQALRAPGEWEATIAGPLDPAAASEALAAFDMALAPYPDGLTCRRGAFAALIQHGTVTVSNEGQFTEPPLKELSRAGVFALTYEGIDAFAQAAKDIGANDARREQMRRAARIEPPLADWESTAARMLSGARIH